MAAEIDRPEPWGARLWLSLVVVLVVATGLESYGIATWPMADDEVPTLVEMGIVSVNPQAFSVPAGQLNTLPKALPVWYAVQRRAMALFPRNELGFRIPSLIFGILTAAAVFLLAARWRGLWFGVGLTIVVLGSQPFIYLSQVNRFYSMPLLLLVLAVAAICLPGRSAVMMLATVLLTALTVLSHNITVVVFVLAFMAACPAWWLGSVPLRVLWRAGAAASTAVLLYFFYIRPLVLGWSSTGNPTPVLVSFAAHVGIPALAFGLLGAWFAIARRGPGDFMVWWALLFAGSVCFLQSTVINWNPRYFLFFMPALWVLAGHSVTSIARQVRYGWAGAAWYGCVAMLLFPSLLSHFVDGSRHDYRSAAGVLVTHAQSAQPILSDDAETISYYLPANLKERLYVRTKVTELPITEFFLVTRANAWTPLPQLPQRHMDVLAEIYRRRYDQFSHVLRVYRVAAASQ